MRLQAKGSRQEAPGLLALVLITLVGGQAFADLEPGESDRDRDRERVPDGQGQGSEAAPTPEENPLPEIIDLMRKVEDMLTEADTGAYTQEEQEKIVRALEGQADAVKRIEELIKRAEEAAQQRQQGGGGSSSQQLEDREKSPEERERERRRREEEERRKPHSPEKGKKEDSPKDDKDAKNDKRKESEREKTNPYELDERRGGDVADRWGNLPPKVIRELLESTKTKMPEAWRKRLEDYYRKLSHPEDR